MMARNMFWKEKHMNHRSDLALKSNIWCRNSYQQDKENKKHVGDEVNGPQDSVCAVDCVVIEVAENYPELRETAAKGKSTV